MNQRASLLATSALAATVLIVAAVAPPGGANPERPTSPSPQSVVVEASGAVADVSELEVEALASDLRERADASGSTGDDLLAQQQFTRVSNEFESEYPENYVGAGAPSGKDASYWIVLKHPPSQAELDVVDGLPVDVELRWGAKANAAEFAAALSQLSDALATRFPAARGTIVGPAPDGGAIEVQYDENAISASDIKVIAVETLADNIPVRPLAVGRIDVSPFGEMDGGR